MEKETGGQLVLVYSYVITSLLYNTCILRDSLSLIISVPPCLSYPSPKLAHIRTGGGATKLWPVKKAELQATPCHHKTPLMYTACLVPHASSYARDLLRAGRLYVSVYTHKLTNFYSHLYMYTT